MFCEYLCTIYYKYREKIKTKKLGLFRRISYICSVMRDKDMNNMDLVSRMRQNILDEIVVQKEMLSFWGHISETRKNIELKISELESSLQNLKK